MLIEVDVISVNMYRANLHILVLDAGLFAQESGNSILTNFPILRIRLIVIILSELVLTCHWHVI